MKIIVCMKQVPATTKVEIDEETGTLKRTSADSRTNPFDLFALECALRIREQRGGTVTVLTMGPQQAESMIRDAIRSFTAPERVWVGEEIAREFYPDEMPEYGVFPPELYVEVLCRDEVAAIMKYAYENNIPVVARGAGTGLAGGANCKYGGIMLSLMKMNRIDPVDTQNMTVTCQPGALITEVAAAASAAGLFYPPDPGEKTASIGGSIITNAGGMRAVRYGVTRTVNAIERRMDEGKREQGHMTRAVIASLVFTAGVRAISQVGLMAIIKKGYAYLGYAGLISVAFPFIITMIRGALGKNKN